MGLIKDFKEFRKTKKQEKILSTLGLTVEDLPYLKEAIQMVKNHQPIDEPKVEDTPKTSNGTQEEKKPNQKMTPEEFVEQFTGEVEEFYPYGRS